MHHVTGGEQVFLNVPSTTPWGTLEHPFLHLELKLLCTFSSYLSPTSFTGPKMFVSPASTSLFLSIPFPLIWFPGKLSSQLWVYPPPFGSQQFHFHSLGLPCVWDCLC